ncbi:hypothetical protein BDZ45DRAFT_201347 [Acephala macrosclerotiorum]|nr:hypothetical protein BDZ45DRAFT_201347 [Acephala macrosclerotiorum]
MAAQQNIHEVYSCRHETKHHICSLYLYNDMPSMHRTNRKFHIHSRRNPNSALLETNTECRREAERFGPLVCVASRGTPGAEGKLPTSVDPEIQDITFSNFKTDILAIRYSHLMLSRCNSPMALLGLERVEKLLLLQTCYVCGGHCLKRSAEFLTSSLERFASLKELYIKFNSEDPRSGAYS